MASVAISYNGSTIHTSTETETLTLPTNGKYMATDVVIVADGISALSATYNGNTILNVNADGTYTLKTAGKIMASDIAVSVTIQSVIYPVKGDLITMTLGNATPAAGTNNQYRVLSINGSIAEVVAMYDIGTTQLFNTASSNTYAGSDLDTYLNTTWYNTLSSTAKSAIVSKTFTQDSLYWGNTGDPDYSGYYGTTNPGTIAYTVSLGSATYGSEITRNIYALSFQDVIDYVMDSSITDGALQNYNIWTLFWNTTSQPSGVTNSWLRSASDDYPSRVWLVNCTYGNFSRNTVTSSGYAARPAFTIDLSKIAFTINS